MSRISNNLIVAALNYQRPGDLRRFRPRRAFQAAAAVSAIFLVLAVPLIWTGRNYGRGAYDQNWFHLPTIRTFARQWPHFDFSDYLSATTPGYHVALAGVARYVSDDLRVLRLVGAIFTLGFLATLAAAAAWRASVALAIVASLAVIASIYVFSSGVWLLPDNVAWWGVLAIVLLCLRRRVDSATYAGGGLLLLALVLVRQSNLWAAAPLCLSAWLGNSEHVWPNHVRRGESFSLRLARSLGMLIALLPSVIVLAIFFSLWHGTVPPHFQHPAGNSPTVSGHNPATPAAVFSEFGFVALFFAGFLWPRLGEVAREHPRLRVMIALGALVGVLSAVIPETSWNDKAGRYSGLWTIARSPYLPTIDNRSLFIVAVAAVGGGMLVAWLAVQERRDRWILGGAWVAFFAAQCAGALPWQRYYEGFVLITLILMASRVRFRREALLGPLAVAIFWGAVTISSIRAPG